MKAKLAFSKFFILFFVFVTFIFSYQNTETMDITGVVEVVKMDDNENITQVEIVVPVIVQEEVDCVNYLVVNNSFGKELLNLTGEKVTATGSVLADADGNLSITITKYEIIKQEKIEEGEEEFEIPEESDGE